jgi:hypothetical protein
MVQIKADATHLVDSFILNNCTFASTLNSYAFYTGSENYIKGLRENNCARYDESARITPSTSYPPQYELNPSTQALVTTKTNRFLDLAVENQFNRMTIVPNVRPCAFHATGGTHTSVTGDGTWYTLISPTTVYDGDVNYSTSTGKFTAPRNGYYTFMGQIWFQNLGSPSTYTSASIALSKNSAVPAGQYTSVLVSPVGASSAGSLILPYTGGFVLTAGDTIEVQVYVAGGAKTVDINGNSSLYGQMIG